eukprot:1050776-Rhodomonas_salina.1
MFSSKTVLFVRRLQIPCRTLAPSRGVAATRPVASAWRLGVPAYGRYLPVRPYGAPAGIFFS